MNDIILNNNLKEMRTRKNLSQEEISLYKQLEKISLKSCIQGLPRRYSG